MLNHKAKIGDYKYGLRKAKDMYCSTPRWLPIKFRRYIEDRAWWICKSHDNACGVNGRVSLFTAHTRFITGLLFKSRLPWVLRLIFAIIALPIIIWNGHGEYGKILKTINNNFNKLTGE